MTMLEKVKAAIKPLIPDECFQDDVAEHHAAIIARAAILAIREPSEAVMMLETLGDDDRDTWAFMIDAILAEKPE